MRAAIIALLLTFASQAGAGCGKLCDGNWWQTATTADVQAELAAGADVIAWESGSPIYSWGPLHFAAGSGNSESVQALLAAGTDVRAQDIDGFTALHWAVSENLLNTLVLLDAGADVMARDEYGTTPLHIAAGSGTPEIIHALLAAGADARVRGYNWKTPRDLAQKNEKLKGTTALQALNDASQGRTECGKLCDSDWWKTATVNDVKTELVNGANLMARDSFGNLTPLHLAAWKGVPEMIQVLLNAGANIEVLAKDKSTPLLMVEKPENVQILLLAGAEVDAQDSGGATSLGYASVVGNYEVARALLSGGADPSSRNNLKNTPLHSAKTSKIVYLLLKAGANVHARNASGKTPLHSVAAWHIEDKGEIQALLDAGADVKMKDSNGKTPWDLAQENQYLKGSKGYWALHDAAQVVGNCGKLCDWRWWKSATVADMQAALDAGVDFMARNKKGETPLHAATAFGKAEHLRKIIKHGGDVHARDELGRTPLSVAAGNYNLEAITTLLTAGADPNVRDLAGVTPMHKAVSQGTTMQLKALLDAGAEVAPRTDLPGLSGSFGIGITPLHLAVMIEPMSKGSGNLAQLMEQNLTANVRFILNAGADVNAKFGDQTPLLHYIAKEAYRDIGLIEVLLDAGADAKEKDKNGKTPWDLVQDNADLKGTKAYWALNDAQYK